VTVVCPKHGDYNVTPYNHTTHKIGCPRCRVCPGCGLWKTYGKLCVYCKPIGENKLYEKTKKKFEKTKEMAIVTYLKKELPDSDFIHNKSVGVACTDGHLFPDIRFDCIWFHLIVEVDEFEHRGANYNCDNKRMHDVTAKLGLPCIFIRYNPDSKDSDKTKLLEKVKYYLALQNDFYDTNNDEADEADEADEDDEADNADVADDVDDADEADEADDINKRKNDRDKTIYYEKLDIDDNLGFKVEHMFYHKEDNPKSTKKSKMIK